MQKTNRKTELFFLLLIIGLTACYGVRKYYDKQKEHKTFALMDYYSSSQELVKYSDNIIIGKVKSVEQPFITNVVDYVSDSSKSEAYNLNVKFEHICSQVEVIKSIKGDLEPGKVIPVLQSGVSAKGRTFTVPPSKIHKNDEQYIFFLRYIVPETEQQKKDYKIPLYLIISPFQGQIKITNDKVNIDSYELPMFEGLENVSDVEKIINDDINALNK